MLSEAISVTSVHAPHPTLITSSQSSFFDFASSNRSVFFLSNSDEQGSIDEIIKLAIENGEPTIGVSVVEVILVIDNKERRKKINSTLFRRKRQAASRLPGKSLHPRTLHPLKKFQFSALVFSINYSNVVQFKILMSFSFFRGHSGRRKLFSGISA